MKVAFNTSLDDTVGLYEAMVLRQRTVGQAIRPGKQATIILVVFVAISALFWWLAKEPPYALIVLFATISFILISSTRRSALRKKLRSQLIKSHPEGDWRAHVTEINDAGITYVCQDNITAFWWSQVNEIVREAEYLRFYTHQCSVAQIPLRVFRSQEDIDRFEIEANRLWQAHKDDPAIHFPEVSGIITDEQSVPSCVLINPPGPDEPEPATELPSAP